MKYNFFQIPVLFTYLAADGRCDSPVSLFNLVIKRESFKHPNRFTLQCDNGGASLQLCC